MVVFPLTSAACFRPVSEYLPTMLTATVSSVMATDSLEMALCKRRPLAGLLVHSDCASQYVPDCHQLLLRNNGFICSVGREGNCRGRVKKCPEKSCHITVFLPH